MLVAAVTLDGLARRSLVREIARSMASVLMENVCANQTILVPIARPEGAKTTAPGKVLAAGLQITNAFAKMVTLEMTVKKRYLVLMTALAMASARW